MNVLSRFALGAQSPDQSENPCPPANRIQVRVPLVKPGEQGDHTTHDYNRPGMGGGEDRQTDRQTDRQA